MHIIACIVNERSHRFLPLLLLLRVDVEDACAGFVGVLILLVLIDERTNAATRGVDGSFFLEDGVGVDGATFTELLRAALVGVDDDDRVGVAATAGTAD
jgi:hypothetical protein